MKRELPYWIEPIIVNSKVNGYSVMMKGGLLGSTIIKTFIDNDLEYARLCAEELLDKLNESI